VSHGKHRAPKTPRTPGLRRLAAGLSLAAAAATIGLAGNASAAPAEDTGWGAPDTSNTPADTGWGTPSDGTDPGTGTTGPGTVTTFDTGWG